ncbi:hypothetical protein Efla_003986 [Eimeria flavescens]
MSESHRGDAGVGVDHRCSKLGGIVSPLMRSCIFGFNSHVAELPSSAADVKASCHGAEGACAPSSAEAAVRTAFLSQLPAELFRNNPKNAAGEKGPNPQLRLVESLLGSLDDSHWCPVKGSATGDEGSFFSAELRSRLAELWHEGNGQGDYRDSRKSTGCAKRGRHPARRLPASARAGFGSASVKSARDSGELIDGAGRPLASPVVDNNQPAVAGWDDNDVFGSTCNTSKQKPGGELKECPLLGALSVSLDNLAEQAEANEPCFIGDSTSCGSPATPSHGGHDNCDTCLHPDDLTTVLDSSATNSISEKNGDLFFRNSVFCLPHSGTRSFQILDDVIEPSSSCTVCERKQAATGEGGGNGVPLPLDAGDVFAEVQMTILALLEDLHAATCCCAAASSLEPCSCCIGSACLVKKAESCHNTSSAVSRSSGPSGSLAASRGAPTEPSVQLATSYDAGSLTTAPGTPISASSLDVGQALQFAASLEPMEAGKNGDDCSAPASYYQSLLISGSPPGEKKSRITAANGSCLYSSHTAVSGDIDATSNLEHTSPNSAASASSRCFSEPTVTGEEKSDRGSPTGLLEPASCADPSAEASSNPSRVQRMSSGTLLDPEGAVSLTTSSNEGVGDSLHLLFRHHVAVVACADLFSEVLPYSHIFRECVGTYRMPMRLPSAARHLLVRELFLLRQDPDRLLARNSFQWADTSGAVSCLTEHVSYGPKNGGNVDVFQGDRMQRADETGRSGSSPSGTRMDTRSGYLCGKQTEDGTTDALACGDSVLGRSSTNLKPPPPLLDPTILLCASGNELAAQKSAVLRILRMLRSLAPSWAARDDNFGFHFKTVIAVASLDSTDLQGYRIVFQCLSPFDAKEWSRDQVLEVLSDLDCIRLAHKRRQNLLASTARVQRLVEHPELDFAGNLWHANDGPATSRQRWEKHPGVGGSAVDWSARMSPPRQVFRGGRDSTNGQHGANSNAVVDSPSTSGSTSALSQHGSAKKEQHHAGMQGALQQLQPSSSGGRSLPKASALSARPCGSDEVSYAESEGEPPLTHNLQPLAAGGTCGPGATSTSSSSRRGQSPANSSIIGRRSATSADPSSLTNAKPGSNGPNDCPARQQYAERAAGLPKIKGVFIGKKHTCWVAQWNDANGQPRQSCFNIKQHGFEKARRLAVQARQALMGMSTTKSSSTTPTEAPRGLTAPPQQPATPSPEAAPATTRLPDLLLTRDATAAIAEALGSRSVQTPTAVMHQSKGKLEGIAAGVEGDAFRVSHNIAAAASGKSNSMSPAVSHTESGGRTENPMNLSRGGVQRPIALGAPANLPVVPTDQQLEGPKKEADRAPPSAPPVSCNSSPPKQQLLLHHRIQQQLEEQLQQLQQLHQLMQQSVPAAQPSVGALTSLLPDVLPPQLPASSNAKAADSSSSAVALVNSLLGGSAGTFLHAPLPHDRDKGELLERSGDAPSRKLDAQQHPAASSEVVCSTSKHLLHAQSLNVHCGDAAVSATSNESPRALVFPYNNAEPLEEDSLPAYSKRKHRLLYVQKQGKRTLASLAREFPSVGGVTYNVKCACWEVTVKGRNCAKVFSTRKFGGLEPAYGAAVMWKRRVERGEQGVEDADGPEGHDDDGEDLEDPEGLPGTSSSAAGGGCTDGDESLRKSAACFGPRLFGAAVGVPLQQQLSSAALPSLRSATPMPDGEPKPGAPLFSRTTSV